MHEKDIMKIAIAESSAIIRSGLAAVLKRMHEAKVITLSVTSFQDMTDRLNIYKPDVLLINPTFLFSCGLEELKKKCGIPELKCIAIMSYVVDNDLLQDFDAAISLYDSPDLIMEKIEGSLNMGKSSNISGQEELSAREKEIVVCVVRGMTNKEIADKLCLSIHTVTTHRRNIARKLQIHSSSGLTIYAIVNKLVALQDVKNCIE